MNEIVTTEKRKQMQSADVVIYNTGEIELKIPLNDNDIWLSANDIASIFGVNRPAIVKHIGNIYKTDELSKNTTCSILEQLAPDGKLRNMNFYNLDMIISVGYRINSKKATKFRQWANGVLKNYIQNGYVLNSTKLTEQKITLLENDLKLLQTKMKNKQLQTDEKINKLFEAIEEKSIKPTQGIFYDGEVYDAYLFVSDLIKSAKKSIVLVDNYLDESVLTMLSKRAPDVTATLYTKNITPQLELDLKKYNAQYPKITLKKFDASHDRFLILDSKELYHIGASLKDLGKKWFAFSKFERESFDILSRLER
ncbi:RhuM family protein [Sulfuricurvum sp.]|jgi:prophage antirepressor-like protein|uniref:RhuM family protein n=1 Tax=Sulfuricurvum sp. TaxID=2025608 RepID=UPI00345850D9